jgi:hypothetical protein
MVVDDFRNPKIVKSSNIDFHDFNKKKNIMSIINELGHLDISQDEFSMIDEDSLRDEIP